MTFPFASLLVPPSLFFLLLLRFLSLSFSLWFLCRSFSRWFCSPWAVFTSSRWFCVTRIFYLIRAVVAENLDHICNHNLLVAALVFFFSISYITLPRAHHLLLKFVIILCSQTSIQRPSSVPSKTVALARRSLYREINFKLCFGDGRSTYSSNKGWESLFVGYELFADRAICNSMHSKCVQLFSVVISRDNDYLVPRLINR